MTASAGNGGGATGGVGVTAAKRCGRCTGEMVSIHMAVDGNDLVMESCQRCDIRRWHLAGQEIDLEQALAQVGEHVGRRR